MVWDKVADTLTCLCVSGIVPLMALHVFPMHQAPVWEVAACAFILLPRPAFSVLGWLKDCLLHGMNHTRVAPERGRLWLCKRFVGNITDEIPWRVGVGVSWMTGAFWEFAIAFAAISWAVLIAYLFAARTEMDRVDMGRRLAIRADIC